MNQKKILNLSLALALFGLNSTSIATRSSLHKIGLGLLSLTTIGVASNIHNRLDEKERKEFESQLKFLRAQLNHKDLEIFELNKQIEVTQNSLSELEKKHENELIELQQQQRQDIAQLASENHSAFEQKISLINRKHAIAVEKLKAEQSGEIQAGDTIIDELRNEKKKLEGTILTLQKEFESIRDDYAQRVESFKVERSHFDASRQQFDIEQKEFMLRQKELKIESHQQIFLSSKKESEAIAIEWEKLKSAQHKYQETVLQAKHSFNAIKAENEVLRQKLGMSQKVLASNNGRYNTASIEGFLADRIESFFRRNQLPINYVQSITTTPDRLKLQFSAKEENKDKIIKLKEALSCDIFGGKDVTVKRQDGYIVIDVPKVNATVETDKVANPDNPNVDYFKDYILNSNHILASGATGDGKTTLISNILDLASTVLPGAELIFLNPKPDPDTKFYFKGNPIKADYLNLETPEGCVTPNCLEGLAYLDSILTERMRQAQLADEQDKPMPSFNPLIMFVDEIPTLLAADKELFCSVMERLSRLGRAYKLIFIGSGQGASVAQWGLKTRDQLQNFSRVYLKSILNTDMVWDKEIKFLPNKEEIAKEENEFKSKVGGKKDSSSYYGLFIPQGNSEGMMAYLPAPNYFINNQLTNNLECPSCHSHDIIKYGMKDGKQAYRCKKCETQFRDDFSLSCENQQETVGKEMVKN